MNGCESGLRTRAAAPLSLSFGTVNLTSARANRSAIGPPREGKERGGGRDCCARRCEKIPESTTARVPVFDTPAPFRTRALDLSAAPVWAHGEKRCVSSHLSPLTSSLACPHCAANTQYAAAARPGMHPALLALQSLSTAQRTGGVRCDVRPPLFLFNATATGRGMRRRARVDAESPAKADHPWRGCFAGGGRKTGAQALLIDLDDLPETDMLVSAFVAWIWTTMWAAPWTWTGMRMWRRRRGGGSRVDGSDVLSQSGHAHTLTFLDLSQNALVGEDAPAVSRRQHCRPQRAVYPEFRNTVDLTYLYLRVYLCIKFDPHTPMNIVLPLAPVPLVEVKPGPQTPSPRSMWTNQRKREEKENRTNSPPRPSPRPFRPPALGRGARVGRRWWRRRSRRSLLWVDLPSPPSFSPSFSPTAVQLESEEEQELESNLGQEEDQERELPSAHAIDTLLSAMHSSLPPPTAHGAVPAYDAPPPALGLAPDASASPSAREAQLGVLASENADAQLGVQDVDVEEEQEEEGVDVNEDEMQEIPDEDVEYTRTEDLPSARAIDALVGGMRMGVRGFPPPSFAVSAIPGAESTIPGVEFQAHSDS
ncbi:hypothetical protein B0H13DRAFT_2393104 [Mycena leptocephala]|nr:hypothetical protein B0H13DRAFT_2393104 [Mycena leptocephala]